VGALGDREVSGAAILLVEGRWAVADSLALPLRKVGLDVTVCHTAVDAISVLKQADPDLLVFDAATMRTSGARTCQRLRRSNEAIPLIHCRGEGEAEPTESGADVYLRQPFTARKLLNRIRALLPANPDSEEIVRVGGLIYYRNKRSVNSPHYGERQLTPKLAELLEQFLRHPDVVLDRKHLMQMVWHTSYIGDTRTLDVHIRWMREIIEGDPAYPKFIVTVRGVGYVFRPAGGDEI
jgi:DNA-binding response OmpR family regulator